MIQCKDKDFVCVPTCTRGNLLMQCDNNIGIKHDFLCFNICWALMEVLKPEPERRNCLKKILLPVPLMAWKSALPANVLKMPLPRQRLTSSLLCTLLMMTSVFMTVLECLFVKPQSRALTAHELPC